MCFADAHVCFSMTHIYYFVLIIAELQGCILDCAEMMEVVQKKGSWYSYADKRFVVHFIMVFNEYTALSVNKYSNIEFIYRDAVS